MSRAASNHAKTARLNFRLAAELKSVVEEAATAVGQSVSDFAISTLLAHSQAVLRQSQATALSKRDRKIFLAALSDLDAKPNRALSDAAKRYKKRGK